MTYDVLVTDEGEPSCTCQDAIYRQRECKHILACRAHGLLPRGK